MSEGDDDVYLAAPALISLLLNPFAADTVSRASTPVHVNTAENEAPMSPPSTVHSADVPDAFLTTLLEDCGLAGLDCEPESLIGCWLSESGLAARAQNKGALASGFFQAMPATLRGMKFRGDATYSEQPGVYDATTASLKTAKATANAQAIGLLQAELRSLDKRLADAFCRLSLVEQLTWAYRYYKPHAGRLVNGGACYAANFVPAWIGHAGQPTWIICAKDGRSDAGAKYMSPDQSEEWFRENEGLDVDKDGAITMGDLAAKAAAAIATPRGVELAARLAALRAGEVRPPETQPEVPALATEASLDIPLSGTPDEPEEV